jgi:hypothetical protein
MGNSNDPILDAMSDTDKEIFASAFGKNEVSLDETGDRTLESMGDGLEGQIEPEDEEELEGDEPDGDAEDEGSEDEGDEGEGEPEKVAAKGKGDEPALKGKAADEGKSTSEGRVPPGRLREETEKRKAVEAERDTFKSQLDARDAEHKKQIDALNARFEGVLAALQRQQPQQLQQPKTADAPQIPDMFEDPKGFADYLRNSFTSELQKRDQKFEEMRIESSMNLAHTKHGDTFGKAYEAFVEAGKRGDAESISVGQRILKSANPGEAMVQWYQRNEVLREVGNDPAKYREKIAEDARKQLASDPEFRKQLLAELREDAEFGDDGEPEPHVRQQLRTVQRRCRRGFRVGHLSIRLRYLIRAINLCHPRPALCRFFMRGCERSVTVKILRKDNGYGRHRSPDKQQAS